MAFKTKIALTTLSICLSTTAWAQQLRLSQGLTMNGGRVATEENIVAARASTLVEVYDMAIDKNLQYLINDQNYRAVFTRIEQAKSKLRPTAYAEARAGYSTMGQTAHSYLSASASLNANWAIYNKELNLGVSISEMEVQLAERQLGLARQELMGLVAKSYLNLVAKEDLVKLSQERVHNLRKVLGSAKNLVSIGVQTNDILGPAQLDLQQAQIKLMEATQSRDSAQTRFESDFGVSFKAYLSARGAVIPSISQKSVSDWLNEAEQNSVRIQIQQLTAEIAKVQIKKQDAIGKSRIDLQARLGVDRNPSLPFAGDLSGQNRLQRGNSIFIVWTKPIWDGRFRSAATDEAVHRQVSAELQTDYARKQVRDDIMAALDNYRLAVNTIGVQRQVVGTSQGIIKSIENGAIAGEVNYDRLLQEVNRLYDNKFDLSQTNIKALEAYIQLKLAAGTLDANDLSLISLSLKPTAPNVSAD